MKLIDSPINSDLIATYTLEIGTIFIFENFLVAEYDEGLHLKFEDCSDVLNIIDKHYGSKPFGVVANRINPYSLVLTDAPKWQKALPNLVAYAVVYYSPLTRQNVELEKRFYDFHRESFGDLASAVEWINMELGTTSSLNEA